MLSFAAPFVLAGLFALFLGAGGLLRGDAGGGVTPAQLPIGAPATRCSSASILLFVLAWVLRA